jgi:hypothetical protein
MGMYADFMQIVKTFARGREDVCFSAKKNGGKLDKRGVRIVSLQCRQKTTNTFSST